jgi:hypothetical protein
LPFPDEVKDYQKKQAAVPYVKCTTQACREALSKQRKLDRMRRAFPVAPSEANLKKLQSAHAKINKKLKLAHKLEDSGVQNKQVKAYFDPLIARLEASKKVLLKDIGHVRLMLRRTKWRKDKLNGAVKGPVPNDNTVITEQVLTDAARLTAKLAKPVKKIQLAANRQAVKVVSKVAIPKPVAKKAPVKEANTSKTVQNKTNVTPIIKPNNIVTNITPNLLPSNNEEMKLVGEYLKTNGFNDVEVKGFEEKVEKAITK